MIRTLQELDREKAILETDTLALRECRARLSDALSALGGAHSPIADLILRGRKEADRRLALYDETRRSHAQTERRLLTQSVQS